MNGNRRRGRRDGRGHNPPFACLLRLFAGGGLKLLAGRRGLAFPGLCIDGFGVFLLGLPIGGFRGLRLVLVLSGLGKKSCFSFESGFLFLLGLGVVGELSSATSSSRNMTEMALKVRARIYGGKTETARNPTGTRATA